jgi:hypothetical protein
MTELLVEGQWVSSKELEQSIDELCEKYDVDGADGAEEKISNFIQMVIESTFEETDTINTSVDATLIEEQ